ncbi:MAG: hypothetical protein RLZZ177_1329 [Pseudomonadota bacterium]
MLNLGRSLQRCVFLLCACLAVQAASAQTSAGSPVTNTLLAVGASKPVDLPTPVNSFLSDPLLPRRWRSPVNISTDLIRTQWRHSNSPTTAFELSGLEPIRAPADGVLLYRGMLGPWESGFVIDHGHGLYSLLSSVMNWNLRTSPEPGSKIEKGQFLSSAVSTVGPSVLTWDVFYSAQPIDSKEGVDLARQLRSQKAINTRFLANIGLVTFKVEGSRDEFSIAVDQRELPRQISFPALFLFEVGLGLVSLEVTTGTFFKTVNKDLIDLSAKGVVTQVIGKKANRGYGALRSSFVAADLSSTDEVMAILSGSATPAIASADSPLSATSTPPVSASPSAPPETMAAASIPTPTPTPSPAATTVLSAPVVVNLEAQRLQALADQRAQELTQLRQQLAQAETQRLQDAQRLAEISVAEQKRQADLLQQQTLAQQRSQELQRPQRIEPAPPTGKRKALVIGNDLYRHVTRLDNARADARAMSQSLQTLGFNVTLALDQTERGLKETLRNFKSSVEGGDEVVVFYAGHGVQIGTTNYLLPVDIAGQNEEQVRDEAIQMQRILDDMQERRTGFLLMIVDACRDNPFKVAGRTLGGRGLAPTTAATGQMVIFSAGTGQQALDKLGADDKEPNGLFTRLFLREMEKPGVSVDRVLRTVRTEVARLARSVGHEQTPALYDQSLGDFFFKP